jgi:hypothetical protein
MPQISNGETGLSIRNKLNAQFPNALATLTAELTFDMNKIMPDTSRHTMVAAVSRTLAASGNVAGYIIVEYIQGDGASTLTFSSDFFVTGDLASGGTPTNNVTYRVTMMYNGSKVDTIIQETGLTAI